MYIVFIIFSIAGLILIGYYLFYFSRVGGFQPLPYEKTDLPPVSVIICAKNEARNLERFLPHVFEQSYPVFEVIVVDDGSEDDTGQVLDYFSERHDHLKAIQVKGEFSELKGKRQAVKKGIETARYDRLVFTDADCRPASSRWLSLMSRHFSHSKKIVLGYSPVEKQEGGGWLNHFLRYDSFYTALQYSAGQLARLPYMGVGRNLAYDKRLFEQSRGFQDVSPTRSGDDDLLVNKMARAKNTILELHPDSFVYTTSLSTWQQLFQQKARHLSTALYYRPVHKILLGLLACSQFCFYVCFAVLLTSPVWFVDVLVVFGLKTLIQFLIFKNSMEKLGVKDLWKYLLLLDVLYLGIHMILLPWSFFNNKDRW